MEEERSVGGRHDQPGTAAASDKYCAVKPPKEFTLKRRHGEALPPSSLSALTGVISSTAQRSDRTEEEEQE